MTEEEQHRSVYLIDYFSENLEKLCNLSIAESKDILQLASYTAVHSVDNELSGKCMDLLFDCCFYLKNLDLKELWNIYWIINRVAFANSNIGISKDLDKLYRFIFLKILDSITNDFEPIGQADSNLVIFITNQFLGIGHAPTKRTLDYAYTIATAFQKKVMIINDASLNFYPCACLEQNFHPNFIENYNHMRTLSYKDLNIPFMQLTGYMPDTYIINETLHKIYQLQPELIYNIGASSPLSDLCSLFTKTACLPCSSNIPTSMSKYLLVGRNLNEEDRKRIDRMEPYQEIIETVINYEISESSVEYERAEFQIQEDDFVIGIVGNRLDDEISNEFIEIMEKAIYQWNAHFLIIGPFLNRQKFNDNISKVENLHFTGELPEASQAIRLFDIYWNPDRNGGGRSSFEALSQGVPVITRKRGDVYYTCGDEFGVETYDEFLAQTMNYIEDETYFHSMQNRALKRAECLSDLSQAQGEILKKILGSRDEKETES